MFQEIVTGGSEEAAFGDGFAPVTGASNTLHRHSDCTGGADLTDKIDVANVDSQLKRGSGDKDFNLAVLKALLGIQAQSSGKRTMMRSNVLRAETTRELEGYLFDEAARVNKDEGRTMILCMDGKSVEYLLPHPIVCHRA